MMERLGFDQYNLCDNFNQCNMCDKLTYGIIKQEFVEETAEVRCGLQQKDDIKQEGGGYSHVVERIDVEEENLNSLNSGENLTSYLNQLAN